MAVKNAKIGQDFRTQRVSKFKICYRKLILLTEKKNVMKYRWVFTLKIDFESQILALFDSYFRPLESHGFCSTCHRIGPLTPTTFLLNFLILLVFIFSDFDALFSQEFLGPMVKAGLNDHSLAIFIFIFYHNDTLTKLNKNVLGVKGPILTEVKQTQ